MAVKLELFAFIVLVSASPLVYVLGSSIAISLQESYGLSKTVFSDKMRVVYLAGLEGVGHHYMQTAFEGGSKVQKAGADNFGWQASMSGTVSHYAESRSQAREQMQGFAQEEQGLQEGQARVVSLGSHLSYPYNGGPDKVFQYVDLRMLADLAEEEGLDLRIVYLRRSAHDMVVADTVHREFQNGLGDGAEVSSEERFIEYLKILFTDMGVIHSMLFELDPAFVVCHDYEALGDPYQASRIANFIGPTETMASRIKETLVGSVQMRNSTGESSLPFEGATIIVDRMQSKLDAFEGTFCAQ